VGVLAALAAEEQELSLEEVFVQEVEEPLPG
jgi:hypothetical protein